MHGLSPFRFQAALVIMQRTLHGIKQALSEEFTTRQLNDKTVTFRAEYQIVIA
jgi:hypothetical protein